MVLVIRSARVEFTAVFLDATARLPGSLTREPVVLLKFGDFGGF